MQIFSFLPCDIIVNNLTNNTTKKKMTYNNKSAKFVTICHFLLYLVLLRSQCHDRILFSCTGLKLLRRFEISVRPLCV